MLNIYGAYKQNVLNNMTHRWSAFDLELALEPLF